VVPTVRNAEKDGQLISSRHAPVEAPAARCLCPGWCTQRRYRKVTVMLTKQDSPATGQEDDAPGRRRPVCLKLGAKAPRWGPVAPVPRGSWVQTSGLFQAGESHRVRGPSPGCTRPVGHPRNYFNLENPTKSGRAGRAPGGPRVPAGGALLKGAPRELGRARTSWQAISRRLSQRRGGAGGKQAVRHGRGRGRAR
jgi:hypothetical protein